MKVLVHIVSRVESGLHLPKPKVIATVTIFESKTGIIVPIVRFANGGENEIGNGNALELFFEATQIDCDSLS